MIPWRNRLGITHVHLNSHSLCMQTRFICTSYIYIVYIIYTFNIQHSIRIFHIYISHSIPTNHFNLTELCQIHPNPSPGQSRTTQAFGDAKIGNLHTAVQGWPCGQGGVPKILLYEKQDPVHDLVGSSS